MYSWLAKVHHRGFQAKCDLFALSPSAEPQSPSAGIMGRPTVACVLPTQIAWLSITTGPARPSGSSRSTVLSWSVLL